MPDLPLGFGRAEIVATIQTMQRTHFYKSMTSYGIIGFGRTCITSRRRRGRSIHGGRRDRVFVAVVQGEMFQDRIIQTSQIRRSQKNLVTARHRG
jgi:hypothetical protein